MVNLYAEDPDAAIASARSCIPAIDEVVVMHGRYRGFPELPGGIGPVYASEHEKRNAMLDAARRLASRDRWLLWLDADERVNYASPQLHRQLASFPGDVAAVRFLEPLPPDGFLHLVAGIDAPGRSVRDRITERFGGRLIRHLPGLRYRRRHDRLIDSDTGRQLQGWPQEQVEQIAGDVDVELLHLWWTHDDHRRQAKHAYYTGATRVAESRPWS